MEVCLLIKYLLKICIFWGADGSALPIDMEKCRQPQQLWSFWCALSGSVSIATFRLHLFLQNIHVPQSGPHVSMAHVGCVDEVCGLSDHGAVYSSPSPLRLRLFGNTAGEADPQFSHVASAATRSDDTAVSLSLCEALPLAFLSSLELCHQRSQAGLSHPPSWPRSVACRTQKNSQHQSAADRLNGRVFLQYDL